MKNKKAQEEMIGFVLIIIIVAVIILVFLTISLRKSSQDVESYEVESFIQSLSQTTTNCSIGYYPDYLDVRNLIKQCSNEKVCLDGISACVILNQTLIDLIENGWQVGENRPYKAYIFEAIYYGNITVHMEKGNFTQNHKGAVQNFEELDISFEIYY